MSLWSRLKSLFGVPVSETREPAAAVAEAQAPRQESPEHKERGTTEPARPPKTRRPATEVPVHPEPPPRRWPDGFGSPTLNKKGGLQFTVPAVDLRIQGVPCRRSEVVSFHSNGRVRTATLARDAEFDGEDLPAGTPVWFDAGGSLLGWSAKLSEPRTFKIRPESSEELDCPFEVPAGSEVLVEWRRLRSVRLAAEAIVDGKRLPEDTDVVFGDSGALSHVTPTRELTLRDVPFAAYETIVFEFGVLREGYPAHDVTIDGVPCAAHELVRFDDDGRLARCSVADDRTIRGIPCAAHTRVYLHPDGSVFECTLARDTQFGPLTVAA